MTSDTPMKAQTHLQPFARGFLPPEAYNFNTYMRDLGLPKPEAKRMARRMQADVVWMNNLYQVNVGNEKDFIHLSIKRRDKQPVHDWRDLQAIKDMLVGPEHEGLELYPRASRVVDTANQYHLWVLKDSRATIPVGWVAGLKLSQDDLQGAGPSVSEAVQREFTTQPEASTIPPPLPPAIDALARIEALLSTGAANAEIVLAIARGGLGKVDTSAEAA